MTVKGNSAGKQRLNRYGVKGILIWYFAIFGCLLALLICSGKLDWVNAWVFFMVSMIYQTINVIIMIVWHPETLNERGKLAKEGTKPFDKIFIVLWMPVNLLSMAIMAWDAVRFQWSYMPFWVLILGVLLTVPGFSLGLWAMLSNPYFELTVRLQEDRNQRVITSGPYKLIRHPGYAGEIIMLLATPLMLGSFWGYVPTIGVILLLIVRTALEDRTLREELPGYEEYANKTRYRLFPYIW